MALPAYNLLSLCAGVGGLDLGIEIAMPGARSIAFVEREAYAAATLAARMEAGDLAQAAIWSDLGTFDARPWRGLVDCVCSGDPCQPNSVAGKRGGADDDRFLIDQVVRIVSECRPRRLFRENVPGNADGQLAALVPALERLGYRVAAGIFSASEVGASHQRERLFVMADADGWGGCSEREQSSGELRFQPEGDGIGGTGVKLAKPENVGHQRAGTARRRGHGPADGGCNLADAMRPGSQGQRADGYPLGWQEPDGHAGLRGGTGFPPFAPGPSDPRWPAILARAPQLEPAVRRVANGLADRVDRLRACGNGVFPLAAANAWCALDALLATGTRPA